MAIRISASDLESWRYWKDGDYPLSDLIARLKHEADPSRQMEAGRAFAKLMETEPDGSVDVATVEGWTFDFSRLDAAISRPPVREIKAEKLYTTSHGPVTLVCKADGLDGRTVADQKLTERWDAEKYLDSLQWRAYLDAFGADAFRYDIFVGRYSDRRDEVTIAEYHPMTFYRYPNLGADVERAVRELAQVIAEYVPGLVTADAQ